MSGRWLRIEHVHREVPRGNGVYFLAGAGLIKIGIAYGQFARRIATLQSGSPVELRLTMVIHDVDHLVESHLHMIFAAYRRHGEWFALPPGWRGIVEAFAERRIDIARPDLEQLLGEAGARPGLIVA